MVYQLAKPPIGFTLLEALIALIITAFLLTGLYRVVNGTVRQAQTLENREETLHLWLHLRRLLRQDLEHLAKEPPPRIILDGKETLILQCTGDLIPNWKLGPRVEVIYQWKKKTTDDRLIWERLVQPLNGKRDEAIVTLRIDHGLNKLEYELLDGMEWRRFGESGNPPWKAIRWRFEWDNIGEWTLLLNMRPLSFFTQGGMP